MDIKVNCVMLALLGTNHTTQEQFEKIKEEFKEVEVAYRNYKHNIDDIANKEHFKTELYDLMQASFTMLNILGVDETDNEKHLKKMEYYKKIKRL